MTCERCHGLMVHEPICEMTGTVGNMCVGGLRCLLCGNLIDAVILENRARSTDSIEPVTLSNPCMSRVVAA